MPIDPPAGFLTRPEAARQFNRSQRALERRPQRRTCHQRRHILGPLETLHERRSRSRRRKSDCRNGEGTRRHGDGTRMVCRGDFLTRDVRSKRGVAGCEVRCGCVNPHARRISRTPERSKSSDRTSDDATYLQQIIRTLEKEKELDRARYDGIIAKLFDQLAVKDRQISAWDEVTQGLTKALATGQLKPNEEFLPNGNRTFRAGVLNAADTTAPVDKDRPHLSWMRTPPPEVTPQKGTGRSREEHFGRRKRNHLRRTARSRKRKSGRIQRQPRKHRWNEFPTLKRFFSRRT